MQRLGVRPIERNTRNDRGRPRPAAHRRPPATANRRCREQANHDFTVGFKGDRGGPPGTSEGEVVRPVDAVEDPPAVCVARLRADLLADHCVGGTVNAKQIEHRLLGVEVDLRHGRAVVLVNGPQLFTGEVGQRDGVGAVGERERQRELARPCGRHPSCSTQAPRLTALMRVGCTVRTTRAGRPASITRRSTPPYLAPTRSAKT
jgi:hypothetical protein